MLTPRVRILKRNLIDDTKWNDAIQQSVNSLPYAYTWYLDAICSRWVGLIVGEYEFIMPLPVGRKWGMMYVYQPLFCQQLGVFYRHKSETIITHVMEMVRRKFLFVNANLNYDNAVKAPVKGLSKKKNLTLRLSGKHSAIQKDYNENTQRNIKKAIKAGLSFEVADQKSFEGFTDFYIAHTAVKDVTFKPKNVKLLKGLIQQFIIHERAVMFVAKNSEGEMCAGVIVVKNKDRIIHLMPAANDYGRQNGGMHFLVDEVLKYYAGSDVLYDFEGSSVDSIARFYEGFGAESEPFFVLSKSLFKRK